MATYGKAAGSLRAGLALVAALAGGGCHEAIAVPGHGPLPVHSHLAVLFGALGARFGPVELDPSVSERRERLARSSLIPSRLFEDPSMWTKRVGSTRDVTYVGALLDKGYRLTVQADAPPPARESDYRGDLRLRSVGPGQYEWTMRDELGVGALSGAELSAATTRLFAIVEGAPPATARGVFLAALPHTAAALGRAFSLDALRLTAHSEGGVLVALEISLHPESLRPSLPRYAGFLVRQFAPITMDLVLRQPGNVTWWEVHVLEGHITIRFRVHGGDLAPLAGPARWMPDRLQARLHYSTKVRLFRVGVEDLEADVELTRTAHEKGFVSHFRKPPEFEMPFFVRPFLRGPLGRPFEGDGALLGWTLHDEPAGTTILSRDYRIALEESWVSRWLGGLSAAAVSDFRRSAESEADRFARDALLGLRDDLLALAPP